MNTTTTMNVKVYSKCPRKFVALVEDVDRITLVNGEYRLHQTDDFEVRVDTVKFTIKIVE